MPMLWGNEIHCPENIPHSRLVCFLVMKFNLLSLLRNSGKLEVGFKHLIGFRAFGTDSLRWCCMHHTGPHQGATVLKCPALGDAEVDQWVQVVVLPSSGV